MKVLIMHKGKRKYLLKPPHLVSKQQSNRNTRTLFSQSSNPTNNTSLEIPDPDPTSSFEMLGDCWTHKQQLLAPLFKSFGEIIWKTGTDVSVWDWLVLCARSSRLHRGKSDLRSTR